MNRAPGYSEHCGQVLFVISKELQQLTGLRYLRWFSSRVQEIRKGSIGVNFLLLIYLDDIKRKKCII